ncbi:MAG: pyridoxal-phosphate dependent enzyme [Bacteroidota bacterium]
MSIISPEKVYVQQLTHPSFAENNLEVSIIRLDLIHSTISGNKWFKLSAYLVDAIQKGYQAFATFGGAYSNHILATAAHCHQQGFKCIGFIRGEVPTILSHTLAEAKELGMTLKFLSRTDYQNRDIEQFKALYPEYYFIDEGGFGTLGIIGIKQIFQWIPTDANFIVAACGTGTTLAGLIYAALPHQKVVGINVLKGYEAIETDIKQLLPPDFTSNNWEMFNHYHFGGYAKKNELLIRFMNELWQTNALPTDFVYESKMMFGLIDLAQKGYFPNNSKVIAIHSGGLQGNLSLPKGLLHF